MDRPGYSIDRDTYNHIAQMVVSMYDRLLLQGYGCTDIAKIVHCIVDDVEHECMIDMHSASDMVMSEAYSEDV